LFNHLIYTLVISIISVPLIYFTSVSLGLMSGVDPFYLSVVVGITLFFNTIVTTSVPTFNMLNHRVAFVVYTSLTLALTLVFSVLLINFWKEDILVWFFGQIVSQALMSLLSVFLLFKYTGEKFNRAEAFSVLSNENMHLVLKFSLPLMVSTFLMWVATDSFRFILEQTHGLEYLGLFSVGFAIAQRFSYATESIVQQVFFPNYYRSVNSEIKSERSQAWLELFYSSVPLYLATMLFTMIFSSYLLDIFSGPSYSDAKYFVILGSVFHFFRKITATFAMSAHGEKKTGILIGPYFVGAIFSSVILYFAGKGSDQLPPIIVSAGSFVMLLAIIYNTRTAIGSFWDKEIAKRAIRGYFQKEKR